MIQVCLWMRVLTASGVEVPWEMMSHLIENSGADWPALEAIVDLIHASESNTAPIPAESYAALCCQLFGLFCSAVDNVDSDKGCQEEIARHALCLLLKAYDVSLDDINASCFGQNGVAKLGGSIK